MSRLRVSPRTDERQPLYLQIQEHFKQLIYSGAIAKNDKFPTEKQLMEQFGVSRMTVSNALTKLAQDGWIYRIPGRGSFVSPDIVEKLAEDPVGVPAEQPRGKERSDRSSSRKMIGLVLPLLEDFFAIRLLKGIYTALEGTDYYVSIVLTHNCKEREKEAIQELTQQGAVGLFIFPIDAETYNEEILLLKLRDFPFVLIDRYLPGFETHCVCSDNRMSAQMAVNHLWELGHRDIAICSDIPASTITVDERIRGYMEALKQKGSMINPALIMADVQAADPHIPYHKHPLYEFIRTSQATAFITLNLRLGLYAADLCRKSGVDVPRDISIITYDNPSSALDDTPAFTHIDQHEEHIGAQAAELLLQLLTSKEKLPDPVRRIVKSTLVAGKSTGACAVLG
ncbi:GntR family transcriptional regulator [Paenibacillus sp. GCM10023248]|uniref:GntR family transcriptional regulator n=1 Tax=Bacillales TaxID=1385 RepID=UPI0023789654|nr:MULTISPECIES: GntR family transcriptional regulator [Bacillales]MDD9268231.1 GntR family transcriptional regulator [Paenibacillus sp. MAHUQ-63]MDR6879908.1 GntR family transcriptional regulator of arabinose operon [Bacillus sp. 3255]